MLVLDVTVAVMVRHVAVRVTMIMLEVDRMVMPVGVDPLVQIGLPVLHTARRTLTVFLNVGPRVEVEVVIQLSVRTPDRKDAELRGKRAVVNVRRTPEVTAGWQVTKLHHPRGGTRSYLLL